VLHKCDQPAADEESSCRLKHVLLAGIAELESAKRGGR
jgi:hypothetical protein